MDLLFEVLMRISSNTNDVNMKRTHVHVYHFVGYTTVHRQLYIYLYHTAIALVNFEGY